MPKLSTRTQEDRRAETRSLLLAAAADLFAHKGFHATSAEAVAAAAHRTTGALYDHFGNKNGLLVAILEGWVEQTILDVTSQFDVDGSDVESRLGSVWDSIANRQDATGEQWLLLEFELWLHAIRDPELGAAGAARFETMRAGLSEGLEQWAGEFGFTLPGSPDEVAAQMIALLIGAAFQYRIDPTSFTKASVVRSLGRLLDLPDQMAPSRTSTASAGV
ncbi:MAG: TetR/AcrR family transcriptional regulator [Microthrixaceae bacterium]